MSTRGFLVLEIVSILAFATDGYSTTPYFACQPSSTSSDQSYVVTMSRQPQISIVNCSHTRVNDLLQRINLTAALRGRPIHLHTSASILDHIRVAGVTDLHLGGNGLTEVHLREFVQLRRLNLTSNRIPSLRAIQVPPNLTLATLDASRNRLLRLEHSSILPTRRLFLTSNNIFELDRNLTLPAALQLLDLTRNEIENISSVSISSLTLQHLNLSVNLINAVSRTTFQHLPALETLVLECNKISEIEPGTFSANLKLVELNLRDNNLAALKKGVFDQLVNLQVLDISKNDLLNLAPDAVQNLNLIDFSVSENAKLCDAECKEDMEFLLVLGGRLRALKMDRLRLRQFPVMLTTSVRRLDLSQNKLDTVQQGNLENFPLLEELTLSGNDIQIIETDAFSRMEFLEVLCLDNNKLKHIPTILPQSLKVLHLHRNRIIAIGKNDFNGLTNLRILKVNSNSIELVDNGAFQFLVSLETLDISNNPIKVLSTEAFEGPNKLQVLQAAGLSMVRINVTDVRYFPISELPNLRRLNLSRSPEMVKSFLTDLPLLATVKQLEVLDLSYANLAHIPTYLETFLPRLQHLRLTGNTLNCTNSWWHEWRQSSSLEAEEWTDHGSGLILEIAPTATRPLHDNISVDSECGSSEATFQTMTGEQFWTRMDANSTRNESQNSNSTGILDSHGLSNIPVSAPALNISEARPPVKLKKLSSRSLSDIKINKPTSANGSDQTLAAPPNQLLLPSITDTTTEITRNQTIFLPRSGSGTLADTITSRSWFGTSISPSLGTIRAESLVWELSTEHYFGIKPTSSLPTKEPHSGIDDSGNDSHSLPTRELHSTGGDSTNSSRSPLIKDLYSAGIGRSRSSSPPTKELHFTERDSRNRSWSPLTEDLHSVAIDGSRSSSSPIEEPRLTGNNSRNSSSTPRAKDPHSAGIDFSSRSSSPAAKELHSADSRNGSTDSVSFFDWFPSYNETFESIEQTAPLDELVEYTHPGFIVFSAITCFLSVIFLTLIAPSCVQQYKLSRCKYRSAHFRDEYQQNIEISSVSAFIETEISLD